MIFFDKNSVSTALEIVEAYVSKIWDTSIEVFVQFTKPCNVYSVVIGTGEQEPLRGQIKLGQNADGNSAIDVDSKSDSGNGVILEFSGLDFNTEYAVIITSQSLTNYFSNSKRVIVKTLEKIEDLRACIFIHNGDNVEVTGTDIDKLVNSEGNPRFDFIPFTANKATLFTGINGQNGIRFDGTDKRYNDGTIPFTAYKFTYYVLFKANRTDIKQTLFTQRSLNGGSTTSGFALTLGSPVNNIQLLYRDESPATVTQNVTFTDTTGLNLLELKVNSKTNGTTKIVAKLNGVNFVSATDRNNLFYNDDYNIGQLAGFADNPVILEAFDGDIYESMYYMCEQNPKEEDCVYSYINRKYKLNIIKQDD